MPPVKRNPVPRRSRDRRTRNHWILAAVTILVLSTWYTNISVATRLQSGCNRNKLDRVANARSWTAQAAADQKIADDPFQSLTTRRARALGARIHREDAAGLTARSHIDCKKAYPLPFPFHI